MQLDAKLVDDRPLAREERSEREGRAKDELPEVAGDEVVADRAGIEQTADRDHRTLLLAAVRAIFEHKQLQIQQLHVSSREIAALEALRAAIEGKDSKLSQFVYADDRRDLLEQGLAILQPNLTHGDADNLAWLYSEMQERVAVLRDELSSKSDAQDELMDANEEVGKLEAPTDPTDTADSSGELDAKNADDVVPVEPAPWETTLAGPELAEPPPALTTLVGPDAPEPPRYPSTLGEPDDEGGRG
jgi:hypothetical protein